MLTTPPLAHRDCQSVTGILARVGDKWSMQVVMSLRAQPHRFNELKRAVDGISQQMLTRTLKGLERDGLVARTVHPTVPPQVEYRLTDLGHSLAEPVRHLGEWALGHLPVIYANRERYDHAAG
ncbi:helix-turn-helix transcriptional regulator [Sphingomonas sp. BT-65]|uniref:winged helix-turn-helix transcriptional regulator n=1 Tax=Sphingomonas sp. BT-65 TaxID=2989821 RepID=UPI002235F7BD|nr:helix-turn-helix domain-containing protein [Sphingomonas sp. BT-65]MCW4461413.1 helix-turn-helix transcriptional regulator [Sphingomonas sp. BT-65]